MGTLSSGLRPIAQELAAAPRVYVDANMPARVVEAMRLQLRWDVLFVMEHDDLRRASDASHFARALDLGRTLLTLDHDFLDAKQFPPQFGPGVIVCSAANESILLRILKHADKHLLRPDQSSKPKSRPPSGRATSESALPLLGRTIELTVDALHL